MEYSLRAVCHVSAVCQGVSNASVDASYTLIIDYEGGICVYTHMCIYSMCIYMHITIVIIISYYNHCQCT